MGKEIMYLMKMGAATNVAATSSIIKIPKAQILTEIESDVATIKTIVGGITTATMVTVPICLEDTIKFTEDVRQYYQKIVIKIGDGLSIQNTKKETLFIYKNSIGNWYIPKYYKLNTTKERSEAQTGDFYILPKASLLAAKTLGINGQGGEIFKFLVNPQNVNINYVKSNTKSLTSAGWTFQHWGNDVPTIDVKGQTLMLKPSTNVVGNTWEKDPILTGKEYQNLATLRTWYWEQNMRRNYTPLYRIGLYYRGVTYIGHFDNFNFVEDAEKPKVLDYSFKFVVEEEQGEGMLLSDDRDRSGS